MSACRWVLFPIVCVIGASAVGVEPPATEKDSVALLVDAAVYEPLRAEFEQYRRDVERLFPVRLVLSNAAAWESATPDAIRAEITRLWKEEGIVGVVLVGQIPYSIWERDLENLYTGINTLYYEELDGTFVDRDSDGRFDELQWGPNTGLEIWAFWMRPPSDDNVGMLRRFLQKCHRYYSGEIRAPRRAIVFSETDYWHMYRDVLPNLLHGYGAEGTVVGIMPFDANPRWHPTLLALQVQGAEIVDVFAHGFCVGHCGIDTRILDRVRCGAVLAMVYGCHTAAFDEAPKNNICQGYVFRTPLGMASAGTSWGAGIPPTHKALLYDRLRAGDYLGRAWFEVERTLYTPALHQERFKEEIRDFPHHNWAISMLGNPFVYLTQGEHGGSEEAKDVRLSVMAPEALDAVAVEADRLWGQIRRALGRRDQTEAALLLKSAAQLGKYALSARPHPRIVREVRRLLIEPHSDDVIGLAGELYGNVAPPEERFRAMALLPKAGSDRAQTAVARAVSRMCTHAELEWLAEQIRSAGDPDVAAGLAESLWEIATPGDVEKLGFLLDHPDERVRMRTYAVLVQSRPPEQWFQRAVDRKDMIPREVSWRIFRSGFRSPQLFDAALRSAREADDPYDRMFSLWLYVSDNRPEGKDVLISAFSDPHFWVRRRALIEVRRYKDHLDVASLMPFLDDPNLWICLTAMESIEETTRKPIEQITGHRKDWYAARCTEW